MTKNPIQFSKLVVLDAVLLLQEHWEKLRSFAEEVIEFSGLSPNELLNRLHHTMDKDPKPMCWTQLAQERIAAEELARRLQDADAVITCWTPIPDSILLANAQLKYVGFWTNLAAHRINLELAKQRGVFVTRIPDYGTDSVAELTFAGILAVSRRLIRSHRDTLRGKWPYEFLKTGQYVPTVSEIPTRILKNKRLGIVGFGRIGKRVAEIAAAFGMRVSYWSRNRRVWCEEQGFQFLELGELFATSDIVSVHLSPNAPQHIVRAELIKCLRDDAIFVNTSAGTLVDQKALFEELATGRISAFLDVYDGLPPRKILKNINSLDNVFTYRSGWYTRESIIYKGEYLLRNIQAFLQGMPQQAAWEDDSGNADEVQCVQAKMD